MGIQDRDYIKERHSIKKGRLYHMDNGIPKEIKNAINLILLTIAIYTLVALINIWTEQSSQGEFVTTIIFTAITCIFPYKLAKGSNATRYVYGILIAISIIFIISGIDLKMTKLDILSSVILTPLEIYIVIKLFSSKASIWFTRKA